MSRQHVPPGPSRDGRATPGCHSPAPPAITLRNWNRRAFASRNRRPASPITLFYMALALDYHKLLTALGARPLGVVDYFRLHVLPAADKQRL